MNGALVLARDVVVVRGPDAASYLQGQLSQDVEALGVGDAAFSLLLQPQGRVDAFLRVTRIADDAFALDVDAGWGIHVLDRLRRFLLRVEVELEAVDWPVVAVRGIDPATPPPAGTWRVLPETPGTTGYDELGPDARVPEGVPLLADADYEAARVAAGVPRMGTELDEHTIPAATGVVDRSVSFTKGCYTGQELVARIDSRGDRVPTKLRRLVVDAGVSLPPGAAVVVADRDVGHVTSAVPGLALAYVRREVEPPTDAIVRWDGDESTARVETLPTG